MSCLITSVSTVSGYYYHQSEFVGWFVRSWHLLQFLEKYKTDFSWNFHSASASLLTFERFLKIIFKGKTSSHTVNVAGCLMGRALRSTSYDKCGSSTVITGYRGQSWHEIWLDRIQDGGLQATFWVCTRWVFSNLWRECLLDVGLRRRRSHSQQFLQTWAVGADTPVQVIRRTLPCL